MPRTGFIDHIGIGVPDLAAAKRYYDGLMPILGLRHWFPTTASGESGHWSWSARWPTNTVAPVARRSSSPRDSLRSEPETVNLRASRRRAMPLMPAPPIPMRWIRRREARSGTSRVGMLPGGGT